MFRLCPGRQLLFRHSNFLCQQIRILRPRLRHIDRPDIVWCTKQYQHDLMPNRQCCHIRCLYYNWCNLLRPHQNIGCQNKHHIQICCHNSQYGPLLMYRLRMFAVLCCFPLANNDPLRHLYNIRLPPLRHLLMCNQPGSHSPPGVLHPSNKIHRLGTTCQQHRPYNQFHF